MYTFTWSSTRLSRLHNRKRAVSSTKGAGETGYPHVLITIKKKKMRMWVISFLISNQGIGVDNEIKGSSISLVSSYGLKDEYFILWIIRKYKISSNSQELLASNLASLPFSCMNLSKELIYPCFSFIICEICIITNS